VMDAAKHRLAAATNNHRWPVAATRELVTSGHITPYICDPKYEGVTQNVDATEMRMQPEQAVTQFRTGCQLSQKNLQNFGNFCTVYRK
jgi:hypothetical protein